MSDDTEWIEILPAPPRISSIIYNPIQDNDPGSGTKTYSIDWDSRWTYNGGALLTLRAYDDENDNDVRDDFLAVDTVSVSVTNPTRNPDWTETFESIGTLGGTSGGEFDGDWFVYKGGTNTWLATSAASHRGSKSAKFGPSGSGNYGANEFAQLYSPVHDCSSATRPYLRIWYKLDVEDSGRGDIAKILLVRYNGIDDIETPLAELRDDTTPAGTWIEQWFNLTGFKSSDFRINFLFDSDNDGNAGTGWFIDDYEIIDADPQIDDIADPSGARGKTVIVNGANFGSHQGSSTITFAKEGGGRTAPAISTWSNTGITVTVPDDAISGNVIVTVLGYDSNGEYFGVSLNPPTLGGLEQL